MPLPAFLGTAGGAAGVQGGANFLTQATQNFFNARETWKQSERNYQMTDYLYNKDLENWNRQNAYNLQMWNMQNEYNSPEQQMQRFKDAGLNPNLIYGQGSPGLASPVQTASTEAAKQGNMPKAEFKMIPVDFLKMFMDVKMNDATIANMEQARINARKDGQLKEYDILIRAKEAGFKDEQIAQMQAQFKHDRQMWEYDEQAGSLKKAQVEAEIAKNISGANKDIEETKKIKIYNDYWQSHGIQLDKMPWWLQFIISASQGDLVPVDNGNHYGGGYD